MAHKSQLVDVARESKSLKDQNYSVSIISQIPVIETEYFLSFRDVDSFATSSSSEYYDILLWILWYGPSSFSFFTKLSYNKSHPSYFEMLNGNRDEFLWG